MAATIPAFIACAPCASTPGSPPCAERKGADRVISISSWEPACSSVSPAQEALALVSLCLLEPKGGPPVPVLRTLLPAMQVTCPALLSEQLTLSAPSAPLPSALLKPPGPKVLHPRLLLVIVLH